MLNFTVGPVQESDEVLKIGGQQTPYFRNKSFSKIMLENESMMKKLAFAEEDSRVVFLTSSGTGAMEAAVMNCLTQKDKVLVINGGTFGNRFAELCELYEIPHTVLHVQFDSALTEEMLGLYENKGYTAFLINMHETSIGKLYDMELVADFCKRNNLFLIVDAISSFLADPINMSEMGINVLITGSQKALAVPPGISVIVVDSIAVKRINSSTVRGMYFNLKEALKNGERGQTTFTPAVGILCQIHKRLEMICSDGGSIAENKRIAELAEYFRKKINGLPLEICSPSLSNAVTPLKPTGAKSAYDIFEILEDKYGIWVCPNGGELRDKIFRVGHIGAIEKSDIDTLVNALSEVVV